MPVDPDIQVDSGDSEEEIVLARSIRSIREVEVVEVIHASLITDQQTHK